LVGLILLSFFLTFNGNGSRKRAGFKILLLSVATISSLAAFNPALLNRIANFFGVGRGADFILYLFIIIVSFSMARLYLAQKDADDKITRLVREISILRARSNEKK
jgi:hypothetical protein